MERIEEFSDDRLKFFGTPQPDSASVNLPSGFPVAAMNRIVRRQLRAK